MEKEYIAGEPQRYEIGNRVFIVEPRYDKNGESMADNKQHDTRTARRPDCVTEIRMGNSVLVVSGYFKKDTTTTAADKMARVLEAEAAATQKPAI